MIFLINELNSVVGKVILSREKLKIMKGKQKLFGTAGIRGTFGKKVTAELVFKVSQAVSMLYPSEGIVIGHDARTSSEALSQCARAAVSLIGGKVFFVSLCTFPVIAEHTLNEKHKIAIYITASHNPPTDNGIKLLRDGREFTEEEQDEIEKEVYERFNKEEFIVHEEWHKILPQEVIMETNARYLQKMNNNLQLKGDKRKLILDCANGPMSELAPKFFSNCGFQVITINSHIDGHFPGRLAEPSPENLTNLIKICRKETALGAAFDGDGDRVAIIDEKGEFVELSRMNALFATLAAKELGAGKVVVSIDSSTVIDLTVEKLGCKVIRTKLGELHGEIKRLSEEGEKVIFAAEPWKPIFISWGKWIDGLYALGRLLSLIVEKQTTVYESLEAIPKHIAKRIAYMVNEEEVAEIFEECKSLLVKEVEQKAKNKYTIDGLRYDLEDGTWILIRKSGTEPKIRIYYESPTPERFEWIREIVKKLEKTIKN